MIEKLDLEELQRMEVEPGVYRDISLYRQEVMLLALEKLNELIDAHNAQ